MYHLPFYRQIQQYREYGVSLNDSTVGGWYEAAVEKLKLLYDLLSIRYSPANTYRWTKA